MAADFEKQSYWHDRFAKETSFEWLLSSSDFISILQPHLRHLTPSSRILHLGSGTSDLHNHFRSLGLLNVTNLDYEPLAADRGRDLEHEAFGDVRMKYIVADATRLPDEPVMKRKGEEFDKESQDLVKYDLVVDKSTCDAIACGGEQPLRALANSIKQCLADGGFWVSLSFSAWRFDFEDFPFHVEVVAHVPTPKLKATDPDIYHYCYLLRPKQ